MALAPITRGELIDIDAADALDGFAFVDALDKISRYVTGDVSDVGMSLAHWRLQEYIGRVVLGSQRAAVTPRSLLRGATAGPTTISDTRWPRASRTIWTHSRRYLPAVSSRRDRSW